MTKSAGTLNSRTRGNVVSELKENIAARCALSVVSALFSLGAYDELKKKHSKFSKSRLLAPCYGDEECFLKNLFGNQLDRRLCNRLDVTRIALLIAMENKEKIYFVFETKSPLFTDMISPTEKVKITCGKEHLKDLGKGVEFAVTNAFGDLLGNYV